MKVHFIAIGGSAMHNLAIALHKKEYTVTGSDDEILDPSKTRLQKLGLLPDKEGWYPEKITNDLDAVIIGMHAREDNPELRRAKEIGLKIYSYPEYIYEQTKEKLRIVVGGSHGKTTVTSILLHVLSSNNIYCDYMVGAQLKGFDTMVKLTKEAKIAVIEGDEYLSSPIDRRPKFHLYKPSIAIITGIAWDHINVFPTFDIYLEQFKVFIDLVEKDGSVVYYAKDENLHSLINKTTNAINKIPYTTPTSKIENGLTLLQTPSGKLIPLKVFGDHNLSNIEGARLVCKQIGLTDEQFYTAIQTFEGASKRLELVAKKEYTAIFKDFAHSPSKLKATTEAVKKQFPNRKLIACMELHTFSSLNESFLKEYKGSMSLADEAIIYFNPHTIAHKKLKPITTQMVIEAFGGTNINVYTDSNKMKEELSKTNWNNKNLLFMSSGNFDGIDFKEVAELILKYSS